MKIRDIILWVAAFTTIAVENVTGSDDDSATDSVCTTAACENAAAELSKSVNLSVDPCNDFYEFACGGFLRSLPAPEYTNYKAVSENNIWRDIDELLVSAVDPKDPRPFNQLKTFYKSCVDEATIEAKSLETLRSIVRELGGWPVVDGTSWTGKNFDWRRPFYMFNSDAVDDYWQLEDRLGYLIHFRIPNYESFDLIETIQSSQGAPWTNDPNDLNDTGSRPYNYYESLIDMAVMLGADPQLARTELRAVVAFEKQLAAIKRYSSVYGPLSIRDLNTYFENVPWMTYVRSFVPPVMTIPDDESIVVYDPDYYVELEALMDTTPKRIQANYIMSKIVLRYGIYSTQNMRRAVETALGPYFNGRDRRTYCRDEIMKYMWRTVTALYADKYYSLEMQKDIFNMFLNIREQMSRQVRRNGEHYWTEKQDRIEVENRIRNTLVRIGVPSSIINIKLLENFHENLNFTDDDYLGNMKALSKFDRELTMDGIITPKENLTSNKFRRWRGAGIGTSLIRPDYSTIRISNEYIRDLYYGIGRPAYTNYGGLGHVIARELEDTLFVDSDSGIEIILDLRSKTEFEDTAGCSVDRNNNSRYENLGSKLKGAALMKENLAGGTLIAYNAYKDSVVFKREEGKLPGFENYSVKQMFWLNLASSQCEKFPPRKMPDTTIFEAYFNPKSRLIRMISNMPEFVQDFNCPASSIVNPVNPCKYL